MTTYREIIYMIFDLAKIYSDDSIWTEKHIAFLMDKYRTLLLKQKYSDLSKIVSTANYQVLCLELDQTESTCINNGYKKSVDKIPNLVSFPRLNDNLKVTKNDINGEYFQVVDYYRFPHVGKNQRLNNLIYATISPDNHLYIKSKNSNIKYLSKVKVVGVFEDTIKASSLSCESEVDLFDKEFPIEDDLIPPLIEIIFKLIINGESIPEDKINNASTRDLNETKK